MLLHADIRGSAFVEVCGTRGVEGSVLAHRPFTHSRGRSCTDRRPSRGRLAERMRCPRRTGRSPRGWEPVAGCGSGMGQNAPSRRPPEGLSHQVGPASLVLICPVWTGVAGPTWCDRAAPGRRDGARPTPFEAGESVVVTLLRAARPGADLPARRRPGGRRRPGRRSRPVRRCQRLRPCRDGTAGALGHDRA
jgi:hypothetical protein